jgi:hypothetical protein
LTIPASSLSPYSDSMSKIAASPPGPPAPKTWLNAAASAVLLCVPPPSG